MDGDLLNSVTQEDEEKKFVKQSVVSSSLLERFKKIEKRTEEVTSISREKRLRYLQKSVKERVDREITLPEDRAILRKYDVKFGPPVDIRKRQIKDEALSKDSIKKGKMETDLEQLNKYLGANDHMKGIDHGKAAPKTGLEEKIDEAIELGDFDTAEKLSDRLATREFGTKIADAFTAKDYIEKKKEEESSKRKKKKLQWGFEQKQRWETKSNM